MYRRACASPFSKAVTLRGLVRNGYGVIEVVAEQGWFLDGMGSDRFGKRRQGRDEVADIVVETARERWSGDVVGSVHKHRWRPTLGEPVGKHRQPGLPPSGGFVGIVGAHEPHDGMVRECSQTPWQVRLLAPSATLGWTRRNPAVQGGGVEVDPLDVTPGEQPFDGDLQLRIFVEGVVAQFDGVAMRAREPADEAGEASSSAGPNDGGS